MKCDVSPGDTVRWISTFPWFGREKELLGSLWIVDEVVWANEKGYLLRIKGINPECYDLVGIGNFEKLNLPSLFDKGEACET